jgi:hypothetical protein
VTTVSRGDTAARTQHGRRVGPRKAYCVGVCVGNPTKSREKGMKEGLTVAHTAAWDGQYGSVRNVARSGKLPTVRGIERQGHRQKT